MTTRYALAHTRREDGSDIENYLPHNYSVLGVLTGDRYDQALIEGTDDAGWTMEDYVIPRLGSGLIGCREITGDEATEAVRTVGLNNAAREIADSITTSARESGDDPIAWVTGNAFMPPLRSFTAAERVWQADDTGEDFQRLHEKVEARLADAQVALECPEHDNALYAVDLSRWEYVDEDTPGDHETLQQDWQPRVKPGTVQVKRDGQVKATFNGDDPTKNSNDAFAWLLKHQGMSTDWAIKHEGWEITDPVPADHAAHNCEQCGCVTS